MKKSAVVILALALLITIAPVLAAPPMEKKVPVEVTFTVISSKTIIVENYTTNGNISHRIMNMEWTFSLTIGDSVTPISGTGSVVRDTDYRYSKPGGVDQVVNDDYVISFPTEGGGFEGQSHSIITDYISRTNYDIRVHVLLHGTGAFKGQTLNAWQSGLGATPLWEGYLLKP